MWCIYITRSSIGSKWSEESKKRFSERKKGCISWNKGLKTNSPSEETKKKLSMALKGRAKGPMSEKQKEDIRKTLLKRNSELKNLTQS